MLSRLTAYSICLLCCFPRTVTEEEVDIFKTCHDTGVCDIFFYENRQHWYMLPQHGTKRHDARKSMEVNGTITQPVQTAPDGPEALNAETVVWIGNVDADVLNAPTDVGNIVPYKDNSTLWLNATCTRTPGELPYYPWNSQGTDSPAARITNNSGVCTVEDVELINGIPVPITKQIACTASCICPPQYCLIRDGSMPSNFSCSQVNYRLGERYELVWDNSTGTPVQRPPENTTGLVPNKEWGCQPFQANPCASACEGSELSKCPQHCVRMLNEADWFEKRSLKKDEYDYYQLDVLTHDNYCCKYLKHCDRNHIFLKAESCNGFVSIFVDVKPFPSKDSYIWKSDQGELSGFVEKINLPVYYANYYIAIQGQHEFTDEDNVTNWDNDYTFFFKSSAGNRDDNKQIVGDEGKISLDTMESADPNLPNIKTVYLSFTGMSDPYKRPVSYHVYYIEGLEEPEDARKLENALSSACTMKRNGVYKGVIKGRSYGLAEGEEKYEISWTINQVNVYLLNIYAENDVGIGQPYVTFQSALPPSLMDIMSGDNLYYIMAGAGVFIIIVGLLFWFGKIKPQMELAAKCEENEKQKLIEEAKKETEHEKIQRVRRANRQKAKDKVAFENGDVEKD